jgi:rhodanese-related sulfurtransferase
LLLIGSFFLLKQEKWDMNQRTESAIGIGILIVTFFLLRYFHTPIEYKIASTQIRKVEFQFIVQQKSILLIDARSPSEFVREHIPGAINIPYINEKKTLHNLLTSKHLQQIQKHKIIVTYCGKFPCGLGEMLAKLIKQIYPQKRVFTLKNGIQSWKSYQFSTQQKPNRQ